MESEKVGSVPTVRMMNWIQWILAPIQMLLVVAGRCSKFSFLGLILNDYLGPFDHNLVFGF